ncbi:MAG: nucleotide sugar dehydrogenase [Chloroflexota bacterium]|nr:nucleotide sugar dehydrogenase [Chloroflexota bacterium]
MLVDKIKTKTAKIGVVGLGYVGLPVALAFAEVGFRVTGLDVSGPRCAQLNRGESYISDIPNERLLPVIASGHFRATIDPGILTAQDAIIICVPTPLNQTRDPDITALKNVTEKVAHYLQRGQLIVLESTTYPGTTEEIVLPALLEKGLKVGEDFFLAFSPERIDPGSVKYKFENTPKIIGGVTENCREATVALYSQVVERTIPVSSPRVAEMTKLFENVFRVVNVALVNEMALMCDRMGLNVWEVLSGANTKPFGIMNFTPGPGVGGHCIPIDPFYLTWKAREFDFHTRFIELAGEINVQMPYHVRELAVRALNRRSQGLNKAKILLLGVAYKKDVNDFRESPAMKIISLLEHDGVQVSYNDPYIPEFQEGNIRHQSVTLDEAALKEADCVIIVTDHTLYDYEWILQHAQVVVDTRNATAKLTENRDKIVLL